MRLEEVLIMNLVQSARFLFPEPAAVGEPAMVAEHLMHILMDLEAGPVHRKVVRTDDGAIALSPSGEKEGAADLGGCQAKSAAVCSALSSAGRMGLARHRGGAALRWQASEPCILG
jgi:hypothetical protein